jgi:hypothetical protein
MSTVFKFSMNLSGPQTPQFRVETLTFEAEVATRITAHRQCGWCEGARVTNIVS